MKFNWEIHFDNPIYGPVLIGAVKGKTKDEAEGAAYKKAKACDICVNRVYITEVKE